MDSTEMSVRLVITADDLGYNPERDRGIIECYQRGAVSRSPLLVNGVSAKEAVAEALACGMPLGLHLNLTEGSPISMPSKVKTLLTSEGYFRGKFGFRDAITDGDINLDEIRMFKELTGSLPDYVDGHQHCHVVGGIAEVFCSSLHAFNIHHSRLPYELALSASPWFNGARRDFCETVMKEASRAKTHFINCGIRHPNIFIGYALMGDNMTAERVIEAITGNTVQFANDGVSCEFMTHPGYSCQTDFGGCGLGPDGFCKSSQREHEMTVLKSDELSQLFSENGVTIVHGVDY